MKRLLRFVVILFSIDLIVLTPLLGSMYVQAATPPTATTGCDPQQIVSSLISSSTASSVVAPTWQPGGDIPDMTVASNGYSLTAMNVGLAQMNPFFDQATFDTQVKDWAKNDQGYLDTSSNTWYFCASEGLAAAFDPAAIDYTTAQYLATLSYPVNKITFDNQLDAYALTGEPCTLFDPKTNLCDETKISQPELNPDGSPKLDANGVPIVDQIPKYYTDIWPNGHWDAPKADARILETLNYLVTPSDQKGAGRELIEVGKILQPGPNDPDFNDPNQSSSHYYDQNNPSSPTVIATGLEITGIDTLRITTKIVQERRLGGNSVSYQYDSIPIKVAYQTDAGAAAAQAAPATNIYQGALAGFSASLGSLLSGLGLNSTIDFSHTNISSIGDVAKLVGTSLVANLINSPTNSLQGWDATSLLNSIGRAYIAEQLNLDPNTLANGDTSDDLIRDIGQAKVEKVLGLPAQSLSGKTATEIWGNVGRRFLEDALGVTPNTLATGNTYSQNDFLQRVGAGYVEQKLGLPAQSLQTTDWSKFTSSFKGQLLFTANDAAYLNFELNLAYQQQTGKNTDPYGFTENDFTDPVGDVIKNHSPDGVAKFLRLSGARAIELSLGKFTAAKSGSSNGNAGITTDPQKIGFVQSVMDAFGISVTTSSFPDSSNPPDGTVTLLRNKAAFPKYYSIYMGSIGQTLLADGFVTQDQLNQLAQMIVTALSTNEFTVPTQTLITGGTDFASTVPQLITLHNNLVPWADLVQGVATGVSSAISGSRTSSLPTTTDTLLSIQSGLNAAQGTMQQFDDSITTSIDSSGQSGQSAALDLPGTFLSVNADGTYGTAIMQIDPVTAFLSGNLTNELMQSVGRLVIASRMSTNKTTQRMIAGATNHDKSTIFSTIPTKGQVTSVLNSIDPTVWLNSGLQVSDFERIFTKDLAPETFDRIGAQVMLSAAWNLYGKDLLNSSGANGILNQGTQLVNQVIEGINFYLTRIQDIQTQTKSISAEVEGLTDVPQSFKDQLKALNLNNPKQTIDDIQNLAAQYEAAVGQVDFSKLNQTIQGQVAKVIHDMQEIAAGHSLSFNQAPSGAPAKNTCFSPLTLQTYFSSASKGSFSTIAIKIAACRVDIGLGLPTGSIYTWYQSKDYTVDGLELAVGQNYAKQTGVTLSNDAAKAKGKLILESAAIGALVGNIPGIGNDFRKLGITTKDILDLLTGNTSQILEKLGSKILDNYFNWPPGTALTIINPQCYDPTTKVTTTCSGADATNVRMNALASIGLKELGVSLNFPTTFNIMGKGDFTTNFGSAQIGELLGLVPNTFTGSFSNVRSLNDPQNVLTGLGWYSSLPVQNLNKLITAFQGDGALAQALSDAQAARDKINNHILDLIADPNSQIWKIVPQNGLTADLNALSESIYSFELSTVSDTLSTLNADIAESSYASDSNIANLLLSLEVNNTTPSDSDIATMGNQVISFLNRVQGLDTQTGQSSGTFQKFLTGTMTADQVSKNDGALKLGQILDKKVFNDLLKNTPFANLYNTVQQLTKTSTCGDGLSIGGLLLGSSAFHDTTECLADSLSGLSLADLFKGYSSDGQTGMSGQTTSKDQRVQKARQDLLVNLASTSWAMQLEKNLDLEPGTLKAIALKPADAPEIAIDQGLRIIGSQLLGIKPGDTRQDDSIQGIYNAFRQSIDAGFCPVDPTASNINGDELQLIVSSKASCSLNFNSQRALGQFKNSLIQMLQTNYQSGKLSKEFGLADIGLVLAGGTQGIYLEGLAHLAAQANALLGTGAKAQAFYINFATVRAAAGLPAITAQADASAGVAGEANWIYDHIDPTDYGMDPDQFDLMQSTMTDQQLVDWYINTDDGGNTTFTDKGINMIKAYSTGEQDLQQQLQHDAQTKLQYQLYDIAAFKLDPNIPPGFSQAMFAGTKYQRAQMLGLFLLNTINSSTHILTDIGLTPQDALTLYNFTAACFGPKKDCNTIALTMASFSKIDTYIAKETGLDLPQGTTAGLIAWASTGFKNSQFNVNTIKIGGQNVPPVGRILENWGMQKLFSWADKALGFQIGSVYQIYQAAQTYLNAYKTLQSLRTINSIIPIFDKEVAQANANLISAKAQLIALTLTIIFHSQISELEKSMGLVPGTGAMAVSILATIAAGAPIPWVQIAIFVALNLFGVYAVEIYQQGTGDGYYPFTGHYGGSRTNPLEYPMPEPAVGEFDVKNPTTYHAGLERAAQEKVGDLLQDLLVMPKKWGAATGVDPKSLWVAQVFTARKENLANLDYLISQPPPWANLGTFGYGQLSDRAQIAYDSQGNMVTTPGQYSGYFYDPGCDGSASSFGTTSSTGSTSNAASTGSQNCLFGNHIQIRW